MFNKPLWSILLLVCPLAYGQGTFAGPGILSRSSGIGQRSGQDVDLKYFVNATGVYDTGLTPYSVTSEGTLVQPGPLYGMEVGVGGYGRHGFRRSSIGLDYTGNFRHYPSATHLDGMNQQLSLDFAYQKSRRLEFVVTQTAGTQTFGTAFFPTAGFADSLVTPGSLLFDNRTSYHQSAVTTRYAMSGRTTISVSGGYYGVYRRSNALVGVHGYDLTGSISHRVSRNTVLGLSYEHSHYDFPRSFGESDINSYTGDWSTDLARTWKLDLSVGVYTAATQGVQSTALDPAIAALLGVGTVQTIFYQENVLPTGRATLTKTFRHSVLSGYYIRGISPGNGVYLTSRQEAYGFGYSYTGARRWSLSLNGLSSKLDSLGQNLRTYQQLTAGGTINFRLFAGLNLTAGYSRRHQDLEAFTFRRDSSRINIGLYFSPGEIPISFH